MQTILSGQLIRRLRGKGTNSESMSIFLTTEEQDFHVQIRGGNPFFDEVLDPLVGKFIKCSGAMNDSGATFLIDFLCVVEALEEE